MVEFKQWIEAQFPQGVLIAIGAYNPIHRGHIRAIYRAKRSLETRYDTDIVAAYIVPKNQQYVDKKAVQKGDTPVPQEDRLEAIRLALRGTFIRLSTVNIHRPLSDQEIRSAIQRENPGKEVFMVVGDDYVQCPGNQRPPCLIDTPDYGKEIVNARGENNFSSTAVRSALGRGEESPMLAPQVLNFIKNRKLWGYTQ